MKVPRRGTGAELTLTLVFATIVSLGLYAYAIHRAGGVVFSYLPFNLLLAWLPFLLAGWLVAVLRTHSWYGWPALILSTLWLIFLPNSFYMITDLIHLQLVSSSQVVVDAVLFISFAFSGLLLGFMSLYLVHQQLEKRLSRDQALAAVGLVLMACSVAIYIGRDLRWNSWDLLTSPAGLLFDVSDRLAHPSEYGAILSVACSFFVLLGGMYFTIWQLLRIHSRSIRD